MSFSSLKSKPLYILSLFFIWFPFISYSYITNPSSSRSTTSKSSNSNSRSRSIVEENKLELSDIGCGTWVSSNLSP